MRSPASYFTQISSGSRRILTLLLFLLPTGLSAQFYQGYQTNFGKNRVQFNDFYWTYYRFTDFDTYFYVGGQELAAYTGKTAGKEIADIEALFDYKSSGRFQFIIFNKLSELKQTNIGLQGDEVTGNTGGLTRVLGNKILLYYDGDHEHFRQQIRAGVAEVLFQQLMFGGNFKDRIQSAVLLTIPYWYSQGLFEYVAKGWGTEEDNKMRDAILSGKYNKFNKISEDEGEFAGHSVWHYVAQNYGKTSIANMLYMARINRNIESGLQYVLGLNLKTLTKNWLVYNQKYYQDEVKFRTTPVNSSVKLRNKTGRTYEHVALSPDGGSIAYIANDYGKYRLYIKDLKTGHRKKVLKGSYKSIEQRTDHSFPLLAWHPSGQFLTVMREQKGDIWMEYYKPGKRKADRSKFMYFNKVLDFSYSADGQEIVLSGVQNGNTDIYVYNVRNRTSKHITDDVFDDLQPRFVGSGKEIVFASSRTNDTLGVGGKPVNNGYDLFVYNGTETLKRITNTPGVNEKNPVPLNEASVAYLSDANGIYNRYVAQLDSVISFVDTSEHYRYFVRNYPQSNYSRNVEEHDISVRKNKYAELMEVNGKYSLFVGPPLPVLTAEAVTPPNTRLRDRKMAAAIPVITPSGTRIVEEKQPEQPAQPQPSKQQEEEVQVLDSGKIDINNYVFQSEFQKPPSQKTTKPRQEVIQTTTDTTTQEAKKETVPIGKSVGQLPADSFLLPTKRNYDLAFSSDYFVTQLDNILQNSTYQVFTGDPFYFDPGLNLFVKIGVNDLMNDYRMSGGFRLSGNFDSNEYFAAYEDLKKRIDKTYSFFRQGREYTSGFSYLKVHTHEAKAQFKYPFNDLTSLRLSVSFRTDRIVTLATDVTSLLKPTENNYWSSIKFEYVFDNTISKGLNLYNGFRYKFFAEGFRQIDKSRTFLGVVGADFRYYLKVHRQIIWANRFAASTSFGDQKLLYYMGSQDNAIVPSDNFDYTIPIDRSQNYGFQAVATNMRGFLQNIRNGNSFALINSELRIPVFTYLLNKPIRSDFIRNFQVAGFCDIGTAWTGSSPFSKDNSFNTQIISQNPVTVILDRQVDPVVAGFGFGLRTRIFGYFIRTDWAWGYEDRVVRDNIFYLSLGLDF